jgi:hypothetical protein
MGLGSGIRDPGSGIQKKPIPDPGSRGQKGTGSQIPDPDPQHCWGGKQKNVFQLPRRHLLLQLTGIAEVGSDTRKCNE